MRTILAVNPLTTYHAVSIWYGQVEKMHQRSPDFDFDLSVNDVSTPVQHLTPDLAGITSERDATRRAPELQKTNKGKFQKEAGLLVTVSVGQTCATKPSMLLGHCGYHDDLHRVHEYKGCKN